MDINIWIAAVVDAGLLYAIIKIFYDNFFGKYKIQKGE